MKFLRKTLTFSLFFIMFTTLADRGVHPTSIASDYISANLQSDINTEFIMKAKEIPYTQSQLKELFDYQDGQLVWKVDRHRNLKGTIAGNRHSGGYNRLKLYGNLYMLHRVVWLYHHGSIDVNLQVDHINRNKRDNHIENLRLVNNSANRHNTESNGFCFDKATGKYKAQICINYKATHLGFYDNKGEARKAYSHAKRKYWDGEQVKPIYKERKGYCWDKASNKWMSQIYINGKSRYIGRFTIESDAKEAYSKAKKEYKANGLD